MTKTFAVPVENGQLCAHFGHCQKFAIIKVKDDAIVELEEIVPPEHQPGLYPRWVAGYDVTDVIAGGMGQKAIHLFNQQNINVFVGAPMKDAKALVEDFVAGNLRLDANYCDHDSHHAHQCNH